MLSEFLKLPACHVCLAGPSDWIDKITLEGPNVDVFDQWGLEIQTDVCPTGEPHMCACWQKHAQARTCYQVFMFRLYSSFIYGLKYHTCHMYVSLLLYQYIWGFTDGRAHSVDDENLAGQVLRYGLGMCSEKWAFMFGARYRWLKMCFEEIFLLK